MNPAANIGPSGALGLQPIRGPRDADLRHAFPDPKAWPTGLDFADILQFGAPRRGLPDEVNVWRLRNASNLWRGLRRVALARALRLPHQYGQVWLSVMRGNGDVVDLGLASMRVVTTAGCRYICDDMNAASGSADATNFKYHGFGVGTTAEAVGNTALVTELTTEYVVNSTRPTGSQASATVSTNATYTTVGTLSPDSGGTLAITEHGIFSADAAGTLLDRSVFAAVNLVAGADSLQATYVLTLASGS
jgi:hypothetical protein